MDNLKVLDSVISNIERNTKKTENFLSVQNDVAESLKYSIKSLYDFTKEQSNRKTDALPELITEGFDEEQIWQQLELQNEGEWSYFLSGVSRVIAGNNELSLPVTLVKHDDSKEVTEEILDDEESKVEENMSVDSEELVEDADDSSEEDMKKGKKKNKIQTEAKKKYQKRSIVDDKFFKLQELDEYLTKEDKKDMKGGDSKGDSEDSDDEPIDLFNDFSEEDDDDDNEEDTEDTRLMKYADFFDSPDTGTEVHGTQNFGSNDENEEIANEDESDNDAGSSDDEAKFKKPKDKRVKFNLQNDSHDTDDSGNEEQNHEEVKSSMESRQERLQKRIKELEGQAVSDKPWQLRGEVDATARPQNSLLEEHVEFDITSRPAPVITEQTTLKLEDIIKQRIKDKAWDDVEKKFKPVETPMEYKKKLILDQEKSKLSLAQIYEDEYLKRKEALNPDNEEKEVEEPKEHIEVREMLHSLFTKLDALSNFHYTPKLAKPEIKIVSNLPAISMEEVAPVATSDATLLAPEEIRAKPRGELIERAERTETDMKRERRQKKLRQRERQKAKEQRDKVVDKLKPGLGNKYSKEKAAKMIDKLSKERNVSKMDETSRNVGKSSTAFFNQLQDQVKSHIKSKTGTISKKKAKNSVSAVKLKL